MTSEPRPLIDYLGLYDRKLYAKVQAAIQEERENITVNAMDLDRVLDTVMMERARLAATEARVKELEQQGSAAADIIVGLAKLLSAARATAKEAQG